MASISSDASEPCILRVIFIRKIDDGHMLRQHGYTLPEPGFPSQVKYLHVWEIWQPSFDKLPPAKSHAFGKRSVSRYEQAADSMSGHDASPSPLARISMAKGRQP
jgi:hypothetical protein